MVSLASPPPFLTTVGVPKELKNHEYRVGLTPSSAAEYVNCGLTVYIEKDAGLGSGFSDEEYSKLGCMICETADEVWEKSQMVVKVKEPQLEEYGLIQENQILYTYFHFAADKELTTAMLNSNAICIAYETVRTANGQLPLLLPMSEIAGRMSIQEAAKYIEKPSGGGGVLLSGVPGVPSAKIVILGGGTVGSNAARLASALGAQVTVLDINMDTLRKLEAELPANCQTLYNNRTNLLGILAEADVLIGAVLVTGAAAPILVKKDDLACMKKGSIVIDVAVDQGGCIATCKPTTHDNPTYNLDGILHYCVGNMPGAVPRTSTIALNNATLFYGLQIASKGYKKACLDNPPLMAGLNIANGVITHQAVAETFNMPYTPANKYLSNLTA